MISAAVATLATIGMAIPTQINGDVGKAEQKIVLDPWTSLSDNPTQEQIKGAVVYLAGKYGNGAGTYAVMWGILKCESTWNPHPKVGDNGKAFGIAQFHKDTWAYFNRLRKTSLNINSVRDQLDMFAWAMNHDLQGNWASSCDLAAYKLN